MTDKGSRLLVWWVDQNSWQVVTALGALTSAPQYLQDQFTSRGGRSGRGRLWVDERFGDVEVDPWPDTALARLLGADYGGIVLLASDYCFVEHLPGVVTDLGLHWIEELRPVAAEHAQARERGAR